MKRYVFPIYAVLLVAMWGYGVAGLSAQQAPGGNGVPAHMVVTVEPHHGKDVPAIQREDVMVYEGKGARHRDGLGSRAG